MAQDGSQPSTAGLLHGDLYRRNLLCRDDKVVGLVDWDDARETTSRLNSPGRSGSSPNPGKQLIPRASR